MAFVDAPADREENELGEDRARARSPSPCEDAGSIPADSTNRARQRAVQNIAAAASLVAVSFSMFSATTTTVDPSGEASTWSE